MLFTKNLTTILFRRCLQLLQILYKKITPVKAIMRGKYVRSDSDRSDSESRSELTWTSRSDLSNNNNNN